MGPNWGLPGVLPAPCWEAARRINLSCAAASEWATTCSSSPSLPTGASTRRSRSRCFGVGYNLQQLAIPSNGRFNPPFQVALDLYNSDILYAVNSNIHTFTGYPVNPQAIQTFDKTTGLPTSGAPVSLTGFPSFMPSTVTYRYSLDAQYDLGHNWVASMGYQGSQSRHY